MSKLEATNFIKDELRAFIIKFPSTRVRYEYDINANVHCIEVVPSEIYHLAESYINWENNLADKFIELYPDQNICFFSDDAIVGIKSVQFELSGSKYKDLLSTNACKSYIDLSQINISNSTNYLDIDTISSSNNIMNNGIAKKVNQSNTVISEANSITSIENQNDAFFSVNYPMAA